jgi:molybdenum cofactor cytidylyltransferase
MAAATKHICGILLAAGLSTRFGSDKLAYRLAGAPLAAWAVNAACKSLLASVTVVCQRKLLPHLPSNPKLNIIINLAPEKGQAASLRLGLGQVAGHTSHILFLLADQPLITSHLINRFVALAKDDQTLACLKSDHYIGAPALFGKKWYERLAKLTGDSGAKKILLAEQERLNFVSADFKGQECDIDRQIDMAKLQPLLPAALSRF